MTLVLDTNAWLWWLHDPTRLSKKARHAVEQATRNHRVHLSVISVWEVALKASLGKLTLPMEFDAWWQKARSYPGIEYVPLDLADAIASAQLPDTVPKDPADRFIVALTMRLGAKLVSADERLQACKVVPVIG